MSIVLELCIGPGVANLKAMAENLPESISSK